MTQPTRRDVLLGGAALAGVSTLLRGGTNPRFSDRVLALGDSYTVATGVDRRDGWVPRLTDRLRVGGFSVATPTVVAEAGWTTADLAAAIDAASPAGRFDLVTLLIGANDAVRERTPSMFRDAFEALLDRAVGFAGGEASSVVAVTIPDYTVTPAGERFASPETVSLLESYNGIVREAAADRGARLVDVVPISREVPGDPSLVAADGLHPSAAQYDRWLDRIYPAALAALQR